MKLRTGAHVAVRLFALLACGVTTSPARAGAGAPPGAAEFHARIQPILQTYCFDCHGEGANKGKVTFDEFKSDRAILDNRELWWKALKNLRAGLMPPARKPRPSPEQREEIAQWIKGAVFGIDPRNPDPGRVTLRRLNRVEYRNTIRDLVGVDFDTQTDFPPDDTGYGFDTIGDVLTLPPMLLEKYVVAAEDIVTEAVPPAVSSNSPASASNSLTAKYKRFFPKEIPGDAKGRRRYAGELLGNFARRAFRRPADEKTVKHLVALAESVYTQPGKTFEAGVAQGMVAVLASPRFLFRQERMEPGQDKEVYPMVDEYTLASRLSYFLWSSMPDEELMRLAGEGKMRQNLSAQVARMLEDKRSAALIKNFTGQWLRARDIEGVAIDAEAVLAREQRANKPSGGTPPVALSGELRRAMRLETEDVFNYVLRQDRSLLELLESDYTFLNQPLAEHYGITNVLGDEMRRVTLPPDSPRGGILTEGTVLIVTSNPTRTSPVKRGLFLLDNVLGTPPPPPPPNIPPLEDAAKGVTNRVLSLRETLAAHRQNPLCSSCHNRMDPLGLALENFNALGQWRGQELGEPIDAAGRLMTGESFTNVKDLKRMLVKNHDKDFYRTVTEKLLTYALGRGLEDYDVETVDQIVKRIEDANGRPSALLAGVVDCAPFQKCRRPSALAENTATGVTASSNLSTP